VCGEAAGDPACACLLLGMGVRNLSMSPLRAGRIRQFLQQVTLSQAETTARDALSVATPKEVQEIVAGLLAELGFAPQEPVPGGAGPRRAKT
jgi:phosphoenolpyruvate-protein phosphotransferase (PTS system enzyme I)